MIEFTDFFCFSVEKSIEIFEKEEKAQLFLKNIFSKDE